MLLVLVLRAVAVVRWWVRLLRCDAMCRCVWLPVGYRAGAVVTCAAVMAPSRSRVGRPGRAA